MTAHRHPREAYRRTPRARIHTLLRQAERTGSSEQGGKRRRTAAAKKVLSPISESTVMASDLVNPCTSGKNKQTNQQTNPVTSFVCAANTRNEREEEERELTPSRDGAMAEEEAGGGRRRLLRSRRGRGGAMRGRRGLGVGGGTQLVVVVNSSRGGVSAARGEGGARPSDRGRTAHVRWWVHGGMRACQRRDRVLCVVCCYCFGCDVSRVIGDLGLGVGG